MTSRLFLQILISISLIITSACNDLLVEYPTNPSDNFEDVPEIRLVTYNIHGGKGPNDEGNLQSNLTAFRDLLMEEEVLCFQEVEPACWNDLKSIFSDYPYRFYLSQKSTKFGTNKKGGNAIFSKLPIVESDEQLVNTDPAGDKWERKAQYVKLFVGGDKTHLHLFHYHNTYNWHNDNSAGEGEGFIRFIQWVDSKDLNEDEIKLLAGDFNLSATQCSAYLPIDFKFSASNWVDHIFVSNPMLIQGIYDTRGQSLSDHQAVWSVVCNEDC